MVKTFERLKMILQAEYFQHNDTPELALDLIGKYIFRRENGQTRSYLISEVEAYHGLHDKASHARFGQTARNRPMFQAGGVWYVYLCYGIHSLLNIVSGEEGFPAAILIRGLDSTFGPGRVTKLLNVSCAMSAKIALPESELWIEDLGFRPQRISALPRVGVDYAAQDKEKPWRFILEDKKD